MTTTLARACLSQRILCRIGSAILLALPFSARAQTLVSWDFSGSTNYGISPLTPTTASSNVSVVGLTRGSGLTTSGSGVSGGWGATGWETSADSATAIANGDFVTFSVTPAAGYSLSLSAIGPLDYRRSSTGPQTGLIQYQLGTGAFVTVGSLNYTSTSSSGATLSSISLSGISELQSIVGTSVTFRIVNYSAGGATGTWYLFDVGGDAGTADFSLTGTVSAVPEPSTYAAAAGSAALALAVYRRRRKPSPAPPLA